MVMDWRAHSTGQYSGMLNASEHWHEAQSKVLAVGQFRKVAMAVMQKPSREECNSMEFDVEVVDERFKTLGGRWKRHTLATASMCWKALMRSVSGQSTSSLSSCVGQRSAHFMLTYFRS